MQFNKKVILALLLVLSLAVFGCGQGNPSPVSQPEEQAVSEPVAEESAAGAVEEDSTDEAEEVSGTEAEENVRESAAGGDEESQASVAGKYSEEDESGIMSGEDYVLFTDAFGNEQKIHKNPERVVCLYNSYADVWDSLGGDLIGRIESTSKLPQRYLEVDAMGSMSGINMEKLYAAEPDLVILASNISYEERIIPLLEQAGIEYMAFQYETIAEYLDIVRVFGEILGAGERAEEIISDVRNGVNSVIAKVPAMDEEPSVLLLFGSSSSVRVKLQNSTVGSMLDDLGTRNIAYDPNLSWDQMETLSMEKVVMEDPDYIFIQTMGSDIQAVLARVKADVESSPAWSSLTAVKEGRYFVLPKDLYLYKANERYPEAYEGLYDILYGN